MVEEIGKKLDETVHLDFIAVAIHWDHQFSAQTQNPKKSVNQREGVLLTAVSGLVPRRAFLVGGFWIRNQSQAMASHHLGIPCHDLKHEEKSWTMTYTIKEKNQRRQDETFFDAIGNLILRIGVSSGRLMGQSELPYTLMMR